VTVTRFVIGPDVALYLARGGAAIAEDHQLVAPTLLRSQVLSLLYQSVRRGDVTQAEADRQLDYLRGLRIRFLGDRVLQRAAWRLAEQLGWEDTLDAEYVALTRLQADAFVTLDAGLAKAVQAFVTIAEPQVLLTPA
jgi:predicted nucleic acid-binding protein